MHSSSTSIIQKSFVDTQVQALKWPYKIKNNICFFKAEFSGRGGAG